MIKGLIGVLAVIAVFVLAGYLRQRLNNKSPYQNAEVKVVDLREDRQEYEPVAEAAVSRSGLSSVTEYYVTFEKKNGEREEFHISEQEYGFLHVGDKGKLSYHGTQYLGFDKTS